jgi:hypothetical protein
MPGVFIKRANLATICGIWLLFPDPVVSLLHPYFEAGQTEVVCQSWPEFLD